MLLLRRALLLAAAVLVGATPVSAATKCFSEDFLFGSATASYQVEGAVKEGGRTPSIWDDFCRERPGVKCANVADDFYHRYKDDVQLMADMGLQTFRFSISWSRVMTWDADRHHMVPNPEGLAFYHALLQELSAKNIAPILTIYHWDLPLALHTELGDEGWLSIEIIDHYVEYATLLFHEFGDKVNYWTTFNEPLSFCMGGYATGQGAPGYTGSPTMAYTATHNMLLSHAKAVRKFRELKDSHVIGSEARIAIVLNADYGYPLDATNPADVAAAERKMEFDVGWFLSPLVTGDYPPLMRRIVGDRLPQWMPGDSDLVKGSYDLFMLNHYSSRMVTNCNAEASNVDCKSLSIGWEQDRGIDDTHIIPGTRQRTKAPTGDSHCAAFTAYPPGYLETIKWLHKHDTSAEILLTENGWCGDDEVENMDQLWYFQAYLEQVYKAVTEEKIPVIGYTAWSFLDNYEWGSYSSRFGLYYVNYTSEAGSPDFYEPHPEDLARTPRPAAHWFHKVATTKCLGDTVEAVSVKGEGSGSASTEHSHHAWSWIFLIVFLAAMSVIVVVGVVFLVARHIWWDLRDGLEEAAAEESEESPREETPLLG